MNTLIESVSKRHLKAFTFIEVEIQNRNTTPPFKFFSQLLLSQSHKIINVSLNIIYNNNFTTTYQDMFLILQKNRIPVKLLIYFEYDV